MYSISLSDSDMAYVRSLICRHVVKLTDTLDDLSLKNPKALESIDALRCSLKHEQLELSLLYNKFCSHE